MADKNVAFFNPSDVLSLAALGWVQQENNIVDSVNRAQGLAANGDEAANQLHGGQSAGTVVYECHAKTGNLSLPKAGQIRGGYHIDNGNLVYQPNGFPRLTCQVHQHDTNPHDANQNAPNTFTPSLTCPAQFGIPRSIGGFVLTNADCGMRGLTYTYGCTHVDEDENGEHLAGENRDGIETMAMEFTGTPTMTVPNGWDELSDGSPKSNTGAQTHAMNWEKHIARD